MEYVIEYSVQSLAENFLIPRKFQWDGVMNLRSSPCRVLTTMSDQNRFVFSTFLGKFLRGLKVVPRNNTDRWTEQC
jgi:hypothetical protein